MLLLGSFDYGSMMSFWVSSFESWEYSLEFLSMVWLIELSRLAMASSCFSEFVLFAATLFCSSTTSINAGELLLTCDDSLAMAVFWPSRKVTLLAAKTWFLSGDFDFLITYIASKSYSLIVSTFYWPLLFGGSILEDLKSVIVAAMPDALATASRSGLGNLLCFCCFFLLTRLGFGLIRCVLVIKCLYSD